MLGPIELVTPPSSALLTTADAKKHCRIDIDVDDAYVDALVATATAYCQQAISGARQFLPATYDLPVAGWWSGSLQLPRPPLSAVSSVKYFDADGAEQTLSTSLYTVRKPWRQPGSITLSPSATLPTLDVDCEYPIMVRFVAGYADAAAVPATIRHAVRLVVGHLYENREATAAGQTLAELPIGVQSLLDAESWGSYA